MGTFIELTASDGHKLRAYRAGLFPMALGMGEGSETNLPLARAVIGGLTVSTIFTLFFIPALYTLLERFSKNQHHGDALPDEPSAAA